MPFRRRMRRMTMRAPIVSKKHQRQSNSTYVGGGVNFDLLVYQGVAEPDSSLVQNVTVGEKVYSVDVSINYIQESSSGNSTINWMLVHTRDGQVIDTLFGTPNGADWSNIGLSKGRNQAIFLATIGISHIQHTAGFCLCVCQFT